MLHTPPLLSALLLLACAEGPDVSAETSVVVRDSAGIEIVELPEGALSDLPEWRLSEEPVVSIGEVEGEEAYLFSRMSHATRLPTGEIAIFDRGSLEWRVFSVEGVHLRSLGGSGEGPGEFTFPLEFTRLADGRLMGYDAGNRRLTAYDPVTGEVTMEPARITECRMPDPAAESITCGVQGLTETGAMLLSGSPPSGPPPATGGRIDPKVVHLWLAEGDSIEWIGSFMHPPQDFTRQDGPGWVVDALFHPKEMYGDGLSQFVIAESHKFHLKIHDASGHLVRIVRADVEPELVTSDVIESLRERIDTLPDLPPGLATYFDRFEIGSAMPIYDVPRLDDIGRLWIPDYEPQFWVGHPGPWRWKILGTDGIPLARIEFTDTRSSDIMEIGDDYVFLRKTDDLGVESVAMYGIERSEGE